jgi:hypothetical protein
MFCVKCGQKMDAGAVFCGKCGNKKIDVHGATPSVGSTLSASSVQNELGAVQDTATQMKIVGFCKVVYWLRLADIALWFVIVLLPALFIEFRGFVALWSVLVIAVSCGLVYQLRHVIFPQTIFDARNIGKIIGINLGVTFIGGILSLIFVFAFHAAIIGVVIIVFLVKAYIALNKITEAETRNEIAKMLDVGETIAVSGRINYSTAEIQLASIIAALTNKRLLFKPPADDAGAAMNSVMGNNTEGFVGKDFIIQYADILEIKDSSNELTINTKNGESYVFHFSIFQKAEHQQWISHLKSMT